MLAYYLNIESITSDLLKWLSNEVIVELFRSGSINTSVFEYVSRETVANAFIMITIRLWLEHQVQYMVF